MFCDTEYSLNRYSNLSSIFELNFRFVSLWAFHISTHELEVLFSVCYTMIFILRLVLVFLLMLRRFEIESDFRMTWFNVLKYEHDEENQNQDQDRDAVEIIVN